MFDRLISQGVQIPSLLDVGAAHGHFSAFFQSKFPNTEIVAVECNERDAYFLSRYRWDTHYMCLGNKPCTRTFYVDRNSEIGGGSSLYKETTGYFDGCIEEQKEITTIDLAFPGATFDLIKIDTQGSELDILKGGADVVSRAKWLLLELSFSEYNEGAPLIDEVLAYLRERGWRMYDTVGPTDGGHIFGNRKIQVDVLLHRV
jgi:FkbM family methyltransferase